MSENRKGPIPKEGQITLESCKEQWRLFANGVLPKFSTKGILQRDDSSQARIEIEVMHVYTPENLNSKTHSQFRSNFDQDTADGLRRAYEFFSNLYSKQMWIISGFVKGENRVPIVVIYYEMFDIAIYARKTNNKSMKEFFPTDMPENFHNN
ncbi:MAG: hypothetical protein WC795_02650 [Candidatus Paceibacterota bacterium]|jgi:hypothetical protein